MTMTTQAGILAAVPKVARYIFFSMAPTQTKVVRDSLARLADVVDGKTVVAALGPVCVEAAGARVPGLHELPAISHMDVEVPSTPSALCFWLRGDDRGELLHLTRQLERVLAPAFKLERVTDAFRYGCGPNGHGRDLTGFEDGTENPKGRDARRAALVSGQGEGLDGSSFMVVQLWTHDLDRFEAMSEEAQDHMIGRRRSDNEELDDAPESAHVKRTAQESFTPEAFVLRRSMPWASGNKCGLAFVAFGKSFDAFEAQMRRMAGLDDGITDALFQISRPVTSACFWCPPLADGRLDLRALKL